MTAGDREERKKKQWRNKEEEGVASFANKIGAKSPPKHQFSEQDLLLSASSEQDNPLDDERFKTSGKFSVNIFEQKAQVWPKNPCIV